MNKDLIDAFDSLKDAECGHHSMVDAILSIEVGDVAEVQVVGQRPGAAIKRAISSASLSSGRSFDFVIDKANNRALIKRIDDGTSTTSEVNAEAIIDRIKERIVGIVCDSGSVYASVVKQRVCRSKDWEDLVISGGKREKTIDDIIKKLICGGVLVKSGAFLSLKLK